MEQKSHIIIECDECGHTNKVPINRIYDGFEGIFQCAKCRQALETLHEILEE